MLSDKTFMRIYLASAIYDLVVTLPFATPWTYHLMSNYLGVLHQKLELGGIWMEPGLFDTFYAALMGTLVLVWCAVRLYLRFPVLARFDAIGRFGFSAWMIYALYSGASALLYGFLVIEISFGIAQSLPTRKIPA